MRDGSIGRLYSTLWKHAVGRRGQVLLYATLLVAAQGVRLTIPWFFGEAVNALQQNGTDGMGEAARDLLSMLLAVGIAWAMHGPARIIERFNALVIRERFADALHQKTLALPARWHEQHHSGDTLYRMTKASASLSTFAQNQYIYLQNTVSIVGPIAALFLVSTATGAVATLGYLMIGFFVVRIDAFLVKLVQEEHRAERRYNSALVDALGNIATVLTLRLQAPIQRMLAQKLGDVFAPLRRNIIFNEVKWAGIDLLNNGLRTGLVALYAFLDWKSKGTIAVGTAVMVHQYAQQVGTVVAQMAMHWNELVRQKTEVAGVDEILEAAAARKDSASAGSWESALVEDVRFVHPESRGDRKTLDGVSLHLARGKRIALVGKSGAGKSSLLRVLAGLVEPEHIAITVDGRPRPDLSHLGKDAMLLPQDPEVFECTIRENISMGLDYDEAEILRACEIAGFTQVLGELPKGLDTLVTERGANLSGGQKQRLALARALVAAKDVRLVLLDEATSSIDVAIEAEIYGRLLEAFKDACIVSSVHRLHLLRWFDQVVTLDRGRVVSSSAAHVPELVHVDHLPRPEHRDDDRQTHGDLGGGHGHHQEHVDVA